MTDTIMIHHVHKVRIKQEVLELDSLSTFKTLTVTAFADNSKEIQITLFITDDADIEIIP